MQLSIAQILAQRASISRRAAAKMISDGRVEVDGKLCTSIATKISEQAKIKLAGHLLPRVKGDIKRQVLLYHKPVGELCGNVKEVVAATDGTELTKGAEATKRVTTRSVFDSLPSLDNGKWIMVGRLDINTSGLLLFTNDGELAYRLMHPKYQLDREYIARVKGKTRVTDETLKRLKQGVYLAASPKQANKYDIRHAGKHNKPGNRQANKMENKEQNMRLTMHTTQICKFNDIVPMHEYSKSNNQYFYLVVQEGRNRLVRRLWESVGYQVSRLMRVRFATINLPEAIKPGKSVMLNKKEINSLSRCVGL